MNKNDGSSFAGIGSRLTPDDVLRTMSGISIAFTKIGFRLRSGGAPGADETFENASESSEIFHAKDATPEAIVMAEKFHPNWNVCSPYSRLLLGRNCHIILGKNLDEPVKFVVCWTDGGKVVGGTGHSLRIAVAYKIPIYNLALSSDYQKLRDLYKSIV